MDQIYLLALFTLGILAVAATLHPGFDDTLTQRAGLCLVGVGSAAEAMSLMQFSWSPDRAHLLLTIGCAVYGVGAGLKTYRNKNKNERQTPQAAP